MNTRRENIFDRAAVRFMIDPTLSSATARERLKNQVYGGRNWIKVILRNLIDPTILPPPSYTRRRADAVFEPAFRRCFEFIARTRQQGDLMEFGTLLGYSARWLAAFMREFGMNSNLWLYDSFEGLPELDSEVDLKNYETGDNAWFKGAMKVDTEIVARIRLSLGAVLPPDRIHVVKGYYEDTLLKNLPATKASLVHIDCDLYASAKYALTTLLEKDVLQDGTLLIFDDYNSGRANPNLGERRAIAEAFAAQKKFTVSPWFSYGWHGQVFFAHDTTVG